MLWLTALQGQSAASGDGHLAGRVPRQDRASHGKRQGARACLFWPLPLLIKPPGFDHGTLPSRPLLILVTSQRPLSSPHSWTKFPLSTPHTRIKCQHVHPQGTLKPHPRHSPCAMEYSWASPQGFWSVGLGWSLAARSSHKLRPDDLTPCCRPRVLTLRTTVIQKLQPHRAVVGQQFSKSASRTPQSSESRARTAGLPRKLGRSVGEGRKQHAGRCDSPGWSPVSPLLQFLSTRSVTGQFQ